MRFRATFGSWSPDGTRLATFDRDSNDPSSLAHLPVIDVVKHTAIEITPSAGMSAPVWSPEGRRMAFLTPDLTVTVISMDGSNPQAVRLPWVVQDSSLLWLPGR